MSGVFNFKPYSKIRKFLLDSLKLLGSRIACAGELPSYLEEAYGPRILFDCRRWSADVHRISCGGTRKQRPALNSANLDSAEPAAKRALIQADPDELVVSKLICSWSHRRRPDSRVPRLFATYPEAMRTRLFRRSPTSNEVRAGAVKFYFCLRSSYRKGRPFG